MTTKTRPEWLLLIVSLPSNRETPRMRLWRALKGMGAAVLRDGVYLLPLSAAAQRAFDEQAQTVLASGGMAQVLHLGKISLEQQRWFQGHFDRSTEYARVADALRALKTGLNRRNLTERRRRLRKLQREFQAIRLTDHFAGAAAEQTAQLVGETEAAIGAFGSTSEPRALAGAIARLKRSDYRARTWATRARPWVDRLASAWLIRRFIDPKARIVWLKDPKRCPRNALGFDFDGAAFTHVGARVTFEVLLASFALDEDEGLMRLARLVHQLDVGGLPVVEAPGVAAVLTGMRATLTDDDRLLDAAMHVLDHLYHSYTNPE
jgi:hypothetical protein